MANILFKRGLHANLPTKAIDGAFYLTEDTHRLYAGIGTDLVDLNQYIQIVENVSDLDKLTNVQLGDFAYINAGNILAVYREHPTTKVKGWTQINENTDTESIEFTGDGNDDGVLTLTVYNTKGADFSDTIKFVGTKGIDVTVAEDGQITIEGNPYTLSKDYTMSGSSVTGMTVTLNSEDEEVAATSFGIAAGKNITFTKTADGISINGTDAADFSDNSTLSVTEGTPELYLELANGNNITLTAENSLYYTYGKTGASTAYNQGKLDVYTTKEVDDLFIGLNPMHYSGTVSSASLPTDVRIGDTYMVATPFSIKIGAGNVVSSTGTTVNVKIGDLFIATGTEDSTGKITAATLTWTYIPAGDDSQTDTVYSYSLNTTENRLSIQESTTGDIVAHIDVDGDDNIVVTSEVDANFTDDVNTPWKLKITHAPQTVVKTTDSASNTSTVTAISEITTDEAGHITGIKTKTTQVMEYELSGSAVTNTNGEGKGVTVTDSLADSLGDGRGTAVFKVEAALNASNENADNLKITANAAGDGFKISMEWGTF